MVVSSIPIDWSKNNVLINTYRLTQKKGLSRQYLSIDPKKIWVEKQTKTKYTQSLFAHSNAHNA